MFRITIEEEDATVAVGDVKPRTVKRYEQTVENLDLTRVIEAVNYKPRVRGKGGAKREPT